MIGSRNPWICGARLMVLLTISVSVCVATTQAWVVVVSPSPQTPLGDRPVTELKVSSWNGAVGAVDVIVHFDPTQVAIVGFSVPKSSVFHGICVPSFESLAIGQMHVACVQTKEWDVEEFSATVGLITWEILNVPQGPFDITVETIAAVGSNWAPMEVQSFTDIQSFDGPRNPAGRGGSVP